MKTRLTLLAAIAVASLSSVHAQTNGTIAKFSNGQSVDSKLQDDGGSVLYMHKNTSGASILEMGSGRTTNGYAYIDMIGDANYTDYGLRLIRGNTGANAFSSLAHRGTGEFQILAKDAAPIAFYTNSSKRMTIQNNGNVGIGTSNALASLHVKGNAGLITLEGNDHAFLQFYPDGIAGSRQAYFGYESGIPSTDNVLSLVNERTDGIIKLKCGSTGYFDVNGNSKMTGSLTVSGNTGIGTLNPLHKLHVISNTMFMESPAGQQHIYFRINTNGNATLTNQNNAGGAGSGNQIFELMGENGIDLLTPDPTSQIAGSKLSRLNIQRNGKVSIGLDISDPTNTPDGYLLYVAQGILTQRLKVAVPGTNEWADYVFADNYELRSLSEVETFISKNKHLPGVPSATEVVKDGIDVTTMTATLLEKIEELTLYIIAQQKEIDAIKQAN